MTPVNESEIETAVRTMFAQDGEAALTEAYGLYRSGGITSSSWFRAANAGLMLYRRETGRPAGLTFMILRETL